MSFYYAQINEAGICFAVSELAGEVIADNMVQLESYDTSLLGKRYVNGTWLEVETETEETE